MIYKYFTVDIIATAKEMWGFIDQKTFKTAREYGFDLLILTDANMAASRTLDICLNLSAIFRQQKWRPTWLGEIMSKLVFYAIGKYLQSHSLSPNYLSAKPKSTY